MVRAAGACLSLLRRAFAWLLLLMLSGGSTVTAPPPIARAAQSRFPRRFHRCRQCGAVLRGRGNDLSAAQPRVFPERWPLPGPRRTPFARELSATHSKCERGSIYRGALKFPQSAPMLEVCRQTLSLSSQ